MRTTGRQALFGLVAVAAIGAWVIGAANYAHEPHGSKAAGEMATGPSGPAQPGMPTASTSPQPEGPTPASTATPGSTPAWRVGDGGVVGPVGSNKAPADAGPTQPSTQAASERR